MNFLEQLIFNSNLKEEEEKEKNFDTNKLYECKESEKPPDDYLLKYIRIWRDYYNVINYEKKDIYYGNYKKILNTNEKITFMNNLTQYYNDKKSIIAISTITLEEEKQIKNFNYVNYDDEFINYGKDNIKVSHLIYILIDLLLIKDTIISDNNIYTNFLKIYSYPPLELQCAFIYCNPSLLLKIINNYENLNLENENNMIEDAFYYSPNFNKNLFDNCILYIKDYIIKRPRRYIKQILKLIIKNDNYFYFNLLSSIKDNEKTFEILNLIYKIEKKYATRNFYCIQYTNFLNDNDIIKSMESHNFSKKDIIYIPYKKLNFKIISYMVLKFGNYIFSNKMNLKYLELLKIYELENLKIFLKNNYKDIKNKGYNKIHHKISNAIYVKKRENIYTYSNKYKEIFLRLLWIAREKIAKRRFSPSKIIELLEKGIEIDDLELYL